MVSMKDIAAACGVSVATVSKALNNHSDIGEETKQHIKEVARQMGYSPNALARALKTNRTYNIGVLFVDEVLSSHPFYASDSSCVEKQSPSLACGERAPL